MKIQYCSDLHLEFAQNEKFLADNPIQAVGDILVLAGDIIYWEPENFKHRFFDYVSDHFKAVYYIPGNHEFYSGKEVQILDRPVFEPLRENVFLVNNKQINIEGIDFFFSLFWSHIPTNEDHIPTQLCNPEQFRNSQINPAFVSEHYDFIADSDIDYWIYGHHHINMPEVEINGTKLVTNQLGYVHMGEHHQYRHSAYIDLG